MPFSSVPLDGRLYILAPSEHISLTVQAFGHGRAIELTASPEHGDDVDVWLSPADARALGHLLIAASDGACDHGADR